MKRLASIVTLVVAAVTPAFGQSAQIPAPAQNSPILIERATIHTAAADGPKRIENGHVLFDKGTILSVGEGVPATLPVGVIRYDCAGLHVAPGMIATMSSIGLVETLQVAATDDRTETGQLHPEVVAATAINPDTDLFPVARAAGVLLSLTTPSGGLIAGRASALRLDGWTPEDIAIKRDVGVVVNWPLVEPVQAWWTTKGVEEQRKSIRENLKLLDDFAGNARGYIVQKSRFPELPIDQRFEAMRGAIVNGNPVFITCGSQGQIESALAWASRHSLAPIIVGGRGIEASIPLLKAHAKGVIVNGTHRVPGNAYERYDEAYALPAKLRDAGIPFAIASGDEPAHERNLPHNAGTAAAFGLTPDEALASITRQAAELSGIGDRYGSLVPGKSATLIVTTSDPLEITSDVLLGFIDGRQLDLRSRQTRLLAKYVEKYLRLGIVPQIRTTPAPIGDVSTLD